MSAITNFLDIYCEEVDYKSFYRDVFPVGSFEEKGVYEDGKYNGIIVEVTKDRAKNGKVKVMRHTVTNAASLHVSVTKYSTMAKSPDTAKTA